MKTTKMGIVRRMSMDAVLTALYFVLTSLTISFGSIEISLGSFPVVLSALVFGAWDSAFVAIGGEFLNQVFKFGITLTTAVWIIPGALRGLVIGFFAFGYERQNDHLENHLVVYFLSAILGALLTTAGNTAAMFIDAAVYEYPISFVILTTLIRFAIGMATAIVIATACIPLTKVSRRILAT